jgi:two-component SAPR family response regulator
MNCIIVDDEPLAREGIRLLIVKTKGLKLSGRFSNANAASEFLVNNKVDLVLLDIEMPGTNGIDFAKTIPEKTLIVFTTAYSEYALDSYEVEAIDYLLKPIESERFQKAIDKAASYLLLLNADSSKSNIGPIANDYFFVKADRSI